MLMTDDGEAMTNNEYNQRVSAGNRARTDAESDATLRASIRQ
jgi:hypothetical protein